jgi:hypothetical protein
MIKQARMYKQGITAGHDVKGKNEPRNRPAGDGRTPHLCRKPVDISLTVFAIKKTIIPSMRTPYV